MPKNWAELEWFRDHEIVFSLSPFHLLTSVPIVKLLLLCDWGTYRAAVCCGMGSVMTAGLMLGG